MNLPNCPSCASDLTYQDGTLLICPLCAHEWTADETAANDDSNDNESVIIKDAVGNVLQDGDAVTVIKDLKVKGASAPLKVGTKVKSIRLLPEASDGHDIDCKIDGFGQMKLKSSVVKKA